MASIRTLNNKHIKLIVPPAQSAGKEAKAPHEDAERHTECSTERRPLGGSE